MATRSCSFIFFTSMRRACLMSGRRSAGCMEPEISMRKTKLLGGRLSCAHLAAFERDAHQPMFRVPRTTGRFDAGGERILSFGRRIVVGKIIDHLLDANCLSRRKLILVQKAAHVGIGSGVHIDGKGGQRLLQHELKGIFDKGRVSDNSLRDLP